MVSDGIDEDTLDIMIEALLRMKTTLTRDTLPTRRTVFLPATEAREAV